MYLKCNVLSTVKSSTLRVVGYISGARQGRTRLLSLGTGQLLSRGKGEETLRYFNLDSTSLGHESKRISCSDDENSRAEFVRGHHSWGSGTINSASVMLFRSFEQTLKDKPSEAWLYATMSSESSLGLAR